MKITTLGKLIGSFGIGIIIISTIQWFFRFPDVSQLVLGICIGIIFIGFAYLHSWMRNIAAEIEKLREEAKDW